MGEGKVDPIEARKEIRKRRLNALPNELREAVLSMEQTVRKAEQMCFKTGEITEDQLKAFYGLVHGLV